MTRTRLAPWIVLACFGTLAACTSTEGGPTGNTELNVIVPNGDGGVAVNSVEYTIVCAGGEQPADGFLDGEDTFTDAVTINGNLEVIDDTDPPVAQGYMDIPPGECLVQLRARDTDGEVICTGDNRLDRRVVPADGVLVVSIALVCGNISYQAPVGQLDVEGRFSYFVGNFCPDLFVLNCLETELGPDIPTPPGDPGPAIEGQTTCEVRFRDNDGGCNEGCDPQVCNVDADGLLECFTASPPEDQLGASMAGVAVRTTVDCGGAPMDCTNNGIFGGATSCTYDGNQLGSLPNPTTGQSDPNPPDFGVNCDNELPGATITCTAYTTDGDRDCDKIKTVDVNCPGLSNCEVFGGDAACQAAAGTVCVTSTCNGNTCDGASAATCCDDVNATDGTDCSAELPPLAECLGGACSAQACTDNASCDDFNACTVPQTCNVGTGLCEPATAVNEPDGTLCQVTIPDDGVCEGGSCDLFVCADAGDCDDSNPCTDDSCDTATEAGVCANKPNAANSCTTCASGTCVCNGSTGTCDDDAPATVNVCQQYSPVPVNRVATCDPAQADECICEKPEFLAVDCELLGNSAPIPLAASAQQFNVAFAGSPAVILPQDAVVLPAALICSFIGAGFTEAIVDNSFALATYTNAIVAADGTASTQLNSFLDDGTAGGAPRSPHNPVVFDFGVACGDNCVGGVCTSDGTTTCSIPTFTQDCPAIGTGPGIIAPTLAGSPDVLIPPDFTEQLVTLVPDADAAGRLVDIGLPYSGIALNLPAVGNPPLAAGCVGGACGTAPNLAPLCSPITRGTASSPRVMYDATCDKIAAGGGTCEPFFFFSTLGDVCKGAGIDAVADFNKPAQLPSCTEGICGLLTTPTDLFCTSPAAVTACCAQLNADFPDATAAQTPQLPVN